MTHDLNFRAALVTCSRCVMKYTRYPNGTRNIVHTCPSTRRTMFPTKHSTRVSLTPTFFHIWTTAFDKILRAGINFFAVLIVFLYAPRARMAFSLSTIVMTDAPDVAEPGYVSLGGGGSSLQRGMDAVAAEPDFDRVVVALEQPWDGDGAGGHTDLFRKLVQILGPSCSKPRAVILFAHADDAALDDAAVVAESFSCVRTDVTVASTRDPPSWPVVPAEHVAKITTTRMLPGPSPTMHPKSSLLVFRYRQRRVFVRAVLEAQVAIAGHETIAAFVRRVAAAAQSPERDHRMPLALSRLPCRVYSSSPAALSRPLPDVSATSTGGSVRVRGDSVPITWDASFAGREIAALGPHTHVWAFPAGGGAVRALINQRDEEMAVKPPVVAASLFFFANLRPWVMMDYRRVYGEGTHSDVGAELAGDTWIMTADDSAVEFSCSKGPTQPVLRWRCDGRFHGPPPPRLLGLTVRGIDVKWR